MNNTLSPMNPQDVIQDIDIRQFIAAVWRNKWRIMVLGMVGGILAATLLLSQPRNYTVKAWVRIEPELSSAGESTHIDTEIKIINSWQVVADTVDALGVTATVTREGSPLVQYAQAAERNLLALLETAPSDEAAAIRNTIRLDLFRVPKTYEKKKFFLKVGKEGEYTLFYGAAKILSAQEGRLVTFSIPGKEAGDSSEAPMQIKVGEISSYPGETYRIAPLSREDYIKAVSKMLSADRTGIRNSNGIIEMTMKNRDPEFARRFLEVMTNIYVQQSLNRGARGKIKMLASLKLRNEQLSLQLRQAEAALETFRQEQRTVDLTEESKNKLKQLTDIQQALSQLQAKKAEMLVLKTESHPAIAALTSQIQFYQHKIEQIEGELQRMPEIERRLFQLTRDSSLLQKIYEENAVEIGKLTNEVAGLTGYAHTLGHAQVQESANLILVVIAGIMGGGATVFLLLAIIFFRSTAIFSVIRNPDMLRMAAKLPVIAAIPRSQVASNGKSKRPLGALLDPHDRAAQVLRDLEAKVKYITYGAGNNIILLTSDLENQGKSFVSANFALLSSHHRRTVLVDGDIVNGKLHQDFASPGQPGFSDLIVGKASIDDVLMNPIEGKLWLIPAGTSVPSHSLLHDVEKMQEIMNELSKRFDLVIVDYPALVTQIDDPSLLKFAGTIFLVVRQGERAARVKRFLAKYPQGLAKVSAVILNDVTKE